MSDTVTSSSPAASVADLIRTQQSEIDKADPPSSWDGLGTTAPTDLEQPQEVVNETPEDIYLKDPEPEDTPLTFDENISETRQRANGFNFHGGNYTRVITFNNKNDTSSAQIYYENGQPVVAEISDQETTIYISTKVLGQITVFAQMCSQNEKWHGEGA